MSFADERSAIENRLSTNWTSTPVQYDNVPFTKPDDNTYVRLNILTGDSTQIDMAPTPTHRSVGVIVMQVFVPVNSGTNTARSHADSLAAIFRNVSFSVGDSGSILCRSPSITRVGEVDGLFQLNVSVPYQRDVVYT